MIRENFRMASQSMGGSRMRSFMTMLGIILGVAAVVTVAGLGQGLRNQVATHISKLGSNLIIVQPGGRVTASPFDTSSFKTLGATTGGVLTEQDYTTAAKIADVQSIAPIATISGLPTADGVSADSASIVGTSEALTDILGKKVEYGSFLTKAELGKNFAVIGHNVAEALYKENVPIGKSFQLRGVDFTIQGVFERSPTAPLSPTIDFNNTVVIGYDKAKEIGAGSLQISQLLLTSKDSASNHGVVLALKDSLTTNHGGKQDFSVLGQEDSLSVANDVFKQLALFTAWMAAISLFISGVGIANVMFAVVSERTREIGIRKAIGATNRQIVAQFVAEAVTLSISGGVIGVIVSLIIVAVLRATTNLEPAIVLPVIGISVGVTAVIGVVSGILPAIKASHKDPIESLRRL